MPSTRSLAATTAVVALVAVSLAAAVGGPAAAAPPPEDVCGVCDSYVEGAVADAGGPDVVVESSRVDIRVRANGTARVVARNRLAAGDADWLANNTDAVAGELAATDAGLTDSKLGLSVRVADDTAVVAYTDDAFAYRSPGVVVVADAFTRTTTGWDVNADRLAVHAPDGYTVATHDRGEPTATWTGSVDAVHVAFAPDRGLVSAAAVRLAVVAATAPAFLRGAAIALAPAVGIVAVLFPAVDTAAEVTPAVSARTAGRATAAAGAVAIAALVATNSLSLYLLFPAGIVLFTAVTAIAAGLVAYRGLGERAFVLAAVGAPLAAAVVAGLAGAYAHPAVAGWTVGRALSAGCLAAQVGVFAALGATRNREGASRWRRFAAVALPLGAPVALLGPTVVVIAWVALLVALAPVAYLLGASVGRRRLRSV